MTTLVVPSLEPYYQDAAVTIYHGDCRDVLPTLGPVDLVLTDPPYELGFMGKAWDKSGISFDPAIWAACYRALKPGGHLLAFGGTRTWHRIAVAIEDAGFELRDTIMWLYGTGFPKSLDVSKAIDKAAGAEREKTNELLPGHSEGRNRTFGTGGLIYGEAQESVAYKTISATDAAHEWEGWGTALKPSFEPVMVFRKPLEGTVAQNVLAHGTGALNIDASRIGTDENRVRKPSTAQSVAYAQDAYTQKMARGGRGEGTGRWPANVILDEEAARMLDEQTGDRPAGGGNKANRHPTRLSQVLPTIDTGQVWRPSSGGASRFFYTAKASRSEREDGIELPPVTGAEAVDRKPGTAGLESPRAGAGRTASRIKNPHPTVKPLSLMKYLITLAAPPGAIILDPFMGSGTTLRAAKDLGFKVIGVELEERYCEIAAKRMSQAVLAL